ncbi:hypothetical protein Dda_4497 [Drechslerella dactyloides]|uniref:Up-regulated during septation protein 1 domain-containing protein n=1 Tax=Drechslerella dactyloides TaxID=74499 RepID=A0AAD6NKM7_DREDA|nr:hypothetical protein Dda_4497 [Drechslerella dactyloides]
MALTLFPPRAPSRQSPQMPDSHATNYSGQSSGSSNSNHNANTTNERQRSSQEQQKAGIHEQSKATSSGPTSAGALSSSTDAADNRISVVPPLPNFAPRSESRCDSPGPYRSTSNSRQNSPTRAAQNLTPPPTISLPPLPGDAPVVTKNGRPVSPNMYHIKAHTISKGSYLTGARMKAKETFLRRKGSMPDIKTTAPVAREPEPELPMDSPTIPGRPPAHDRQASLPASAFSAPPFGDSMFKHTDKKEHKRSTSIAKDVDRSKALLHKRSESALKLIDIPKLQLQTSKVSPGGSLAPIPSPGLPPAGFTSIPSPPDDLPPSVPPKDTAPLNIRGPTSRARTGSEPMAERAVRHAAAHKRQASAQELKSEPPRVKTASSTHTSTANKRKSTANRTMPRGMRPVDVVKTLQVPVIESLQTAARKTCEKFAVLSPAEVDALTAELASLEERCEYLRRTHQSLRSGKKALHMKMLQHLRSDRSSSFSRETLLKQQEALADLDGSIDDWEAKMERAETRRAQVHRKLLEHVAAALSISNPTDPARADTPPSTPENRKSLDDKTQSIKVYALLADVEHEYGKMFTEARS